MILRKLNLKMPPGFEPMAVVFDALLRSLDQHHRTLGLPQGVTFTDLQGVERGLGRAFNPPRQANVSVSRDFAESDVGSTMNYAASSGTVTWSMPNQSTIGWNLGDTISVTRQSADLLTIDAVAAAQFRLWLGDGAAIASVATFDVARSGRVWMQYIGSDLWDCWGVGSSIIP